eukprot:scaffold174518_cov31-Tisochrysis_lutea.AAC.11
MEEDARLPPLVVSRRGGEQHMVWCAAGWAGGRVCARRRPRLHLGLGLDHLVRERREERQPSSFSALALSVPLAGVRGGGVEEEGSAAGRRCRTRAQQVRVEQDGADRGGGDEPETAAHRASWTSRFFKSSLVTGCASGAEVDEPFFL